MKSPFIYGKTVSNDAFTDRTQESEKLSNNLLQGINTIIISPRRWGKSSLVEKVVNTINGTQTDLKTVVIDLFSVSTEEEFLELFAKEVIKASSSKWQDWLKSGKDLFKQLVPKLSVGVDPSSDFSLSFDWEELKRHKDEILNLPEVIAQKKNIRFVVCLDEFQNLATFPDYEGLEKKMRAIWQRQKKVCYCLYGSKRHMMTEIFNNTSKPFYRFGDIILLQKISGEDWYQFILESFESTGKTISEEMARKIPQLMKDHSWYVQQLAHYTWQKTEKNAKMEEVAEALNELIQANSPLYQKEVENISGTQLNLLKAISKGAKQLTAAKTMQEYKLGTPRNVSKNKNILINEDIIHETSNGFEFLDPAFELWFKKIYFNQDYLDLLHP
jgi:AAA+ ATPase superfamily predicted ATPase